MWKKTFSGELIGLALWEAEAGDLSNRYTSGCGSTWVLGGRAAAAEAVREGEPKAKEDRSDLTLEKHIATPSLKSDFSTLASFSFSFFLLLLVAPSTSLA